MDDIRSQFHLYVSAAPDLTAERGTLGHAITEIPTTLGWRITYTPQSGEPLDWDAVARADAHLLVLGADISAPVGMEWQVARRAGRLPRLFRRDVLHTLAADAFTREIAQFAPWHAYRDAHDLRRQALAWLGELLVERAPRFALNPDELEKLRAWLKELESAPRSESPEAPRETAHSGVVLSPERYVPREGKVVGSSR